MSKKKNRGENRLKIRLVYVIPLFFAAIILSCIFLWPNLSPFFPGTVLPYQDPTLSIDMRVDDLLGRMTIAEKIGQMALVEKNSIHDPKDIAKYGLGGLLSGAGAKPDDNTPEGWLRMVNGFQAESRKTRLGIPLLYGVDANHGHGNVPGSTIFPHAIGLAASNDPALVRNVAKATAEEVAATGMNWVFSPDLDVVQDNRWGRAYETFGSNPKLAGLLGNAFVEGLQSSNQQGFRIAATAKHYVGNGSTEWGTSTNENFFIDQGNSSVSDAEMRSTHIEPFKQAISANVKTVMVGLNEWNGEKVSFSTYLLTDVLKKELGFQGIIFSDWYGVYEREPDQYVALVKAINAGVDMVMLPFDYKSFSDHIHRAVESDDIPRARLDEAVRRVLGVKFELGLFEASVTDPSNLEKIGSKPHRDLARMAVRQSLVSLKNTGALPISRTKTQTILVSGSAANNIGMQSGGWTVEWQGIDGNWIPGTTILQGIQETAPSLAKVEYVVSGDFFGRKEVADIGIAVVGEKPYSEGVGDKEHPSLSAEDVQTIFDLKKVSKSIIVVIVSGRPLDIKPYAKDWDAIVAAWLPGSEGRGVADVLFGDFPFTGSLPVSWDF